MGDEAERRVLKAMIAELTRAAVHFTSAFFDGGATDEMEARDELLRAARAYVDADASLRVRYEKSTPPKDGC